MCKVSWRSFALVLAAMCVGQGVGSWAAQPDSESKQPSRPPELSLGAPVQFKNLTVYPVLSREARNEDLFITLDEGLIGGKVTVAEVGTLARQVTSSGTSQSTVEDDPFADPQPVAGAFQTVVASPVGNFGASRAVQRRLDRKARLEEARNALIDSATKRQMEAAVHQAANTTNRANHAPRGTRNMSYQTASSVNRLLIVNSADRPLYLMPGEIIVGGQQDRTLAHETIIPPGKEPVAVDVFCVEHGRWAGRSVYETARLAQTLSGAELSAEEQAVLSQKAAAGQFVRSAGSLNMQSRKAVQTGKGQGEVWSEVAKQNKKSGAETASDAFTANYAQPAIMDKLRAYAIPVQAPIAQQERAVGVIVVINGKPEMIDVFVSTPLFLKLWPKLLKSYALDACGAESLAESKPCQVADAQAFLDSAAAANVVETSSEGQGLLVTKRSNDRIDSFSARPRAAAGMLGGGSAGFGGGVHLSGFAK